MRYFIYRLLVFILFIVTLGSTNAKSQKPFVHPGLIVNSKQLNELKKQIANKNPQRVEAYNAVLAFIDVNRIATSYPEIVMAKASGSTPTEHHIRKDAILAYAYALKWAQSAAKEDGEKAIEILNGWANNFKGYDIVKGTPNEQMQLEAAWVTPTFASAAEIIKNYNVKPNTLLWSKKDQLQFEKFLLLMSNKYIEEMLIEMRGDSTRRRNNWGTSAAYAKMAVGVYLNKHEMYEDGKQMLLTLIPRVIKPNGEVFEYCGRDCHHPQYTTSGITLAAEIALNQGDKSVYEALNQRLKLGYEWFAKGFNGKLDCRDCSKSKVMSAIDVANKQYSSPIINSLITQKRTQEVDKSLTFASFFSYTHRP